MNSRIAFALLAGHFLSACHSPSTPLETTSHHATKESVSSGNADSSSVLPKVVTAGGGKIEYLLRFPKPHTHYLEIEAKLPITVRPGIEVMMPVWTPGSYLVREYARHVEGIRAEGGRGRAVEVKKTAKNRWKIDVNAGEQITLF